MHAIGMSSVLADVMILDPIEFDGSIERPGVTVAVRFTATIDDNGELRLSFEPIEPSCAAALIIPDQRVLTPLEPLMLRGQAAGQWTFESATFYIDRWSRLPDHVEITGSCGVADLGHPAKPGHHDACAWFFRKLAAIHPIWSKDGSRTIVLKGYRDGADQQLVSLLAVESTGQEDEAWWRETESLLNHLRRVLSIACDVYLLPVIEQRHRAGRYTLRVAQRSRAPVPFMPPFRDLFMEEIFGIAILSYDDHAADVIRLEPAIRWLTAPVALAESRLTNAMSALECILASSTIEPFHMPDQLAFDELRSKVASFLKDQAAPKKMAGKLRELNRRSFAEKLNDLRKRQSFPTNDFPKDWLKGAIEARNIIIHTGVSPDLPEDDTLIEHVVHVREIVTRLILAAIGFEGQYQSWLHRCADIRFPSCAPVGDEAGLLG